MMVTTLYSCGLSTDHRRGLLTVSSCVTVVPETGTSTWSVSVLTTRLLEESYTVVSSLIRAFEPVLFFICVVTLMRADSLLTSGVVTNVPQWSTAIFSVVVSQTLR